MKMLISDAALPLAAGHLRQAGWLRQAVRPQTEGAGDCHKRSQNVNVRDSRMWGSGTTLGCGFEDPSGFMA